jgi:T5SS/PEP-CTERM-associated repeat protein
MQTMSLRLIRRATANRLIGAALLLAGPLPLAEVASAQTFWVADGVGNWNVSANWSAGVPTGSTSAEINNGGTARLFDPSAVADDLILGLNPASIGTLEVIGGEATIEDNLWVGDSGTGTLNITGGGVISNPNGDIEIGRSSGSTGTVTVDGAGSQLRDAILSGDSGVIYAGDSGTGTLSVTNGGTVSSFDGRIARRSNSNGTVTVDGPGSNWTLGGPFFDVGFRGTGTLNITGGGMVTNADADIGDNAGSNGTVTVAGANSTWTNGADLSVGASGTGTLSISAGGKVSNVNANIGELSGSSGTVTVDGVGSMWTNTSVLAVGSDATGMLTITGAGVVTSFLGRIGRNPGSTGTVLIDGAGSRWSAGNVFTMGLAGTGTATLEVRNGGVLSVAAGMSIGPNGTVRGDGTIAANVSAAGGLIAPGNSTGFSTATLQVTGNYAQSTLNATLQIELSSNAAFDKLAATGAMTLGGVLDVQLADGYVPHGSRSFDILDWGSQTGLFDAIILPTLGGTLVWDASQLYSTGVLSVVSPSAPILTADFDDDGDVDGDDLNNF